MKDTKIAGIPGGIVNNHNEVLYSWVNSGIKGATLFRVDAHSDMDDEGGYLERLLPKSYFHYNIVNFNCPAVYHGIVDSIYWLNPHSKFIKLQDLGTVRTEKGRRKIGVVLESSYYGPGPAYKWSYPSPNETRRLVLDHGKVISPTDIKIPTASPLIADFDLDAFCTHTSESIHNLGHSNEGSISDYGWGQLSYDGISGFEKRIAETTKVLQRLPKPDLVTIARSLGDGGNFNCYVPTDKVDQVQECLIEKLKEIY